MKEHEHEYGLRWAWGLALAFSPLAFFFAIGLTAHIWPLDQEELFFSTISSFSFWSASWFAVSLIVLVRMHVLSWQKTAVLVLISLGLGLFAPPIFGLMFWTQPDIPHLSGLKSLAVTTGIAVVLIPLQSFILFLALRALVITKSDSTNRFFTFSFLILRKLYAFWFICFLASIIVAAFAYTTIGIGALFKIPLLAFSYHGLARILHFHLQTEEITRS